MNVDKQIKIIDELICEHIENYNILKERGFLSQSILNNLRHFVEAICVKISGEEEYTYNHFQNKSKDFVSSKAQFNFLTKFHNLLQKTVSHFVNDKENSERLMLKYYEYLIDIKLLMKKEYKLEILKNLEKFPINTDPALQEYYEKIFLKINEKNLNRKYSDYIDRFYIWKIKPFFVNQEKYYEVTFSTANSNVSKFDKVIAFTKSKILTNYSVKLNLSYDNIEIFGKKMPIQIIENWEVSIRPCEIYNFGKIFNKYEKITSQLKEYKELMLLLTKTEFNLVDVINFSENYYKIFKNQVIKGAEVTPIFNILDEARKIIKNNLSGSNIILYLLYNMNNKIIKKQLYGKNCTYLSNLNLNFKCIPFDKMPFIFSPAGHNPRIFDLINCIDISKHRYELLARLIKNNSEQKGMLYTPISELDSFEDIETEIRFYNSKLYHKHRPTRDLERYCDYIYINNYEQDTLNIIRHLKELSKSGITNYSKSIESWLKSSPQVDCNNKKKVLISMFENSHVALIYGAAGTGKTKLIEHISNFFHDKEKLFLANTNPAKSNLENRVRSKNSSFKTVSSFINSNFGNEFDLLIIDECSTISNSDMLKVLEKAKFKLLILVGDVFQIESILFGNWFGICQDFIPKSSCFNLTNTFRTTDEDLLELWKRTRNIEDNILEQITKCNYSSKLDESIFDYNQKDEIILCLNYDGLYGINNINKFLQRNNENLSVSWGIQTYKVGDPILFNESNPFKPLIYNNLKGKILNIVKYEDKIKFEVEVNKTINEIHSEEYNFELIENADSLNSVISFYIDKPSNSDEDDESLSELVPFQVAYAISIHKAQGLEYNSVKIIITNEIEELITHNIFYTAITRAKEKLKIYWSPETEKLVLNNLKHKINKKDISLIKNKFNL